MFPGGIQLLEDVFQHQSGLFRLQFRRQVVAKVPVETLRPINRILGRNFITKYGTKQGIIVLGRVAPFGIGAVIGGGANAALATLAVRAARRAFGPPTTSWP